MAAFPHEREEAQQLLATDRALKRRVKWAVKQYAIAQAAMPSLFCPSLKVARAWSLSVSLYSFEDAPDRLGYFLECLGYTAESDRGGAYSYLQRYCEKEKRNLLGACAAHLLPQDRSWGFFFAGSLSSAVRVTR